MNPLVSIWTQPKETIRYVLEYKTWSYSFFILFLSSIGVGMTSFAETDLFSSLPLIAIILLGILSTFIGSIISLFIAAGLYTWVGKWLRGNGNFNDMLQMVPIASIPLIWLMPINLIIVIIFGKALFTDSYAMLSGTSAILLLVNLLTLGVSIYSTVILSKGIGIVHHFSSWRGFGVIMIIVGMFLVLLTPFIVILMFILFASIV
ncbi:Yip1 family protein [Sporosarcina sp. GW1-11]|uniref:Yip1 family protein n=1 Tax=Sporosarcina sp. GW1-11 TaxID=2899126 RepID=UPI00294BD5A8|nr:Yip1 family protein [Sporosarcina sp. GW1-11]MDV6377786.1 Yip1 family protein [Sporosarcina sp. GW1-11]